MPLLAGIGPLGVPELLIIAFIVILVFGVGRLPEVGGALGKGIREFRKSSKEGDDDAPVDGPPAMSSASTPETSSTAPPVAHAGAGDTVFCGECGARNQRDAKFCNSCGHSIGAVVG
jgi:sec-independent protein translocase protein TatA